MKIRKTILTVILMTIMVIFIGQLIFVISINSTSYGNVINKELSSKLTSIIEKIESRISGREMIFTSKNYNFDFVEPLDIGKVYLQGKVKGEVLEEIIQRMRLEICLLLSDQPELLKAMYKSNIISGNKSTTGDFFPNLGIVTEEKMNLSVGFFSVKKQYRVYLGIEEKGGTIRQGAPEEVTEYWLQLTEDKAKFKPKQFTSSLLPPFGIAEFEIEKSFLTGIENIYLKFLTPKDRNVVSNYSFKYR